MRPAHTDLCSFLGSMDRMNAQKGLLIYAEKLSPIAAKVSFHLGRFKAYFVRRCKRCRPSTTLSLSKRPTSSSTSPTTFSFQNTPS